MGYLPGNLQMTDMIKIIPFIFLFFTQVIVAQQPDKQLLWPDVTKETRPWVRWWWPGSIGTKADMTAALNKYKSAGLGGMELTVLYGVKGQEEKFVPFLSPAWMKMFEFILSESGRMDLGVDLANSSSWPFGGPWVTENEASKYVAWKTYSISEGESLKEKIIYIQEPWIKWNGTYRADIKDIIDPVYKNKNLQLLAIDQIKFEKPIPLQVLMAYSDKGNIANITSKVDASGNLDWTAPSGKWTLYAVFEGLHGKMVERAGPGGEGLVIDHFSASSISGYLKYFDNAFKGYSLDNLRGFFNDSYEVDDARGQSCWTPDLFNQFKTKRGYDLKENLPALFQKDTPEKNARVLSDYRQTISDLILEKFTKGWTSWANKQGKLTRNQAHGSPGNILDLYAASDIPETEGTDIFRMKFGTSAANVSGKKLASAEAATWLGEHFSSTLYDVKKVVDQYFIAGVNHIVYHGTCFSPEYEPWPGFQFYAAVEFSPANSFWTDFSILNSYVTRVQSFMQNSKPDNDILLYFPIFDRFADYNNAMLEHFDAISPRFNGSYFKKAAEMMNKSGYSFDYISDLQIAGIFVDENLLYTGGIPYSTLILPGCKYIPVETFNRIINLADKGSTIIFYGNLPEDVSGWNDLESNREMFGYLKEQLKFTSAGNDGTQQALIGKGKILMGNNLDRLLSDARVRRESMTDTTLKFIRKKTLSGNCYFILNQSSKPFNSWISLSVKAKSAAIFNPMNGAKGIAKTKPSTGGNLGVRIMLAPMETSIVQTFAGKVNGEPYNYWEPSGAPVELTGQWTVKFIEGGPELPSVKDLSKLTSWTEFGSDSYKNFSGTAEYTIALKKPPEKTSGWMLNLGRVYESARVYLNNKEIADLIGPDYQIFIDRNILKTENTLSVRVTNLSANRVAWLDRNNVDWKKFYNTNYPARLRQNSKNGLFDASAWPPRESGLIGPVTLTPLKKAK
jgi:hypothetical protein